MGDMRLQRQWYAATQAVYSATWCNLGEGILGYLKCWNIKKALPSGELNPS
jgi:hypothetical protein